MRPAASLQMPTCLTSGGSTSENVHTVGGSFSILMLRKDAGVHWPNRGAGRGECAAGTPESESDRRLEPVQRAGLVSWGWPQPRRPACSSFPNSRCFPSHRVRSGGGCASVSCARLSARSFPTRWALRGPPVQPVGLASFPCTCSQPGAGISALLLSGRICRRFLLPLRVALSPWRCELGDDKSWRVLGKKGSVVLSQCCQGSIYTTQGWRRTGAQRAGMRSQVLQRRQCEHCPDRGGRSRERRPGSVFPRSSPPS